MVTGPYVKTGAGRLGLSVPIQLFSLPSDAACVRADDCVALEYSSWIGSGAREGALLGVSPIWGVLPTRCAWDTVDWTSCAAVNGASNWFNWWVESAAGREAMMLNSLSQYALEI